MYTVTPGLVFGFHGCDQAVADAVIQSKDVLRPSKNSYDWLGHGIYFWENNIKAYFHPHTDAPEQPLAA